MSHLLTDNNNIFDALFLRKVFLFLFYACHCRVEHHACTLLNCLGECGVGVACDLGVEVGDHTTNHRFHCVVGTLESTDDESDDDEELDHDEILFSSLLSVSHSLTDNNNIVNDISSAQGKERVPTFLFVGTLLSSTISVR